MSVELDHVVIIGAGMAGLLSAGALAPYARHISIIETDALRDDARPRAGVPQAPHSHLLLVRGRQAFETIFPGFDADLARHAPDEVNWGHDVQLFTAGGQVQPFASAITTRPCSRVVLEQVARARVRALANVRWDRAKVSGLVWEGARVVGARAGERTFLGDLTIDASGRGSRLREWWREGGFTQPAQTVVNAHLGYASRLYARAPGDTGHKGILMTGRPPHHPRAGGLWALGDQWLVTLAGAAHDHPPTDVHGFLAFARSLQSSAIHDVIAQAQPTTKIHGFRRTENRWIRYDRCARHPDGVLAIGDAICAFNPIYGQGMSIAALQALFLAACCRDGKPDVPVRFHRGAKNIIAQAWLLATSEDSQWPGTEGAQRDFFARTSHRYIGRLMRRLPTSPPLAEAFLRVMHLLEKPSTLAKLPTLMRVLGSAP